MQIDSLENRPAILLQQPHRKFRICKVFMASKSYANEYSWEVKPIHLLLPNVSCGIGHFILNAQYNVLLLSHYVGQICYMEYSFPRSKFFLLSEQKSSICKLCVGKNKSDIVSNCCWSWRVIPSKLVCVWFSF